MPQYELSQEYYFKENGQKLYPGDTVDLTEGQAALHNHNNPGLLKLARQTTQGSAKVIRSDEVAEEPKVEEPKAEEAVKSEEKPAKAPKKRSRAHK